MSIKRINTAQLRLEQVKQHYDELSGELYDADQAVAKIMEHDAQKIVKALLKATQAIDQGFIDLESSLDDLNNYESDYEPPCINKKSGKKRTEQDCELCGQHISQCRC